MQRKDVERLARLLDALSGDCAHTDGWEDGGATCTEAAATLRALLAERDALQGQLNDLRNGWANSVKAHADALAERDAAFAAGQASVIDWLDSFDTTGWDDREAIWAIGWVAELVRKILPIKPHP